MQRRHFMRRLAIGLRLIGLTMMAGALAAAGWRSDLPAAFAQVIPLGGKSSPIASPGPAGRPSASPLSVPRGGPLTFSLSGNVAVGARMQQSSFAAQTAALPGQNQAIENAGLLLAVQRRTGLTMTSVNLPLGIANGSPTRFGELQAMYVTPSFGLTYQAEPLALLGQLPLGSTFPGFGLIVPIRSGDVTAFEAPAYIENGLTARVAGIRARKFAGSTLFEASFVRARSESSPEQLALGIFGFEHAAGELDETLEAALEQRSGAPPGESGRGFAYQFRSDFGGPASYGSLTLRQQSNTYLALGSGGSLPDQFGALSYRGEVKGLSIGLDESLDRSGNAFSRQVMRSDALTASGATAKGVNYAFSLQDEHQLQAGEPAQWTGDAAAQLDMQIFGVTTMLSGQVQRVTGAVPQSDALYGLTLQHQLGRFALTYTGQAVNSTAAGSNTVILSNALSGTLQFGRGSVSLSGMFMRTRSPGSDALQITPLISVMRTISPALTLGVNFGEQITHDPINPAADGHSRIFNVTVNAPFSFGNGLVTGRANPRLPATILGSVVSVIGASSFAGTPVSQNGLANIEVVLDDTQVERTDLTGHFQFNFVTPGRHQVRVETASLPRGVTADQPYAVVNVQGGQSAQVMFQIGSFGGIQGHVYGRDPNGNLYPIAGATLKLDGVYAANSSPLGTFGFGRLTPGKHTVSLDPNSLPANVVFPAADSIKTATVQNGRYTTVDFIASPLGSIAGKLVYDPSLGPLYANQPVLNAYVVAEPGENAAITDGNGNFLIDDLGAGTYSVSVDPETLQDGLGPETPAVSVDLQPGEHLQGMVFTIGRAQKAVIFSFHGSESPQAALISLSRTRVPPAAQLAVYVDAVERARAVSVLAFGQTVTLAYSHAASRWEGLIEVPADAKAGSYSVAATVHGKRLLSASTHLTVDPSLPIAFFQLTPAHPLKGQYVVVRARFLTKVRAGDRILWQDGQTTVLPKPNAPEIFIFTVKISEQPYHGLLLTREARLPITVR